MLLLLVAFSYLQTKAKSRHNQPTPTPTLAPNIALAWDPVPATTDPYTSPVGYKLHIGFISGAENQTHRRGQRDHRHLYRHRRYPLFLLCHDL
jgi:hypothetical protein